MLLTALDRLVIDFRRRLGNDPGLIRTAILHVRQPVDFSWSRPGAAGTVAKGAADREVIDRMSTTTGNRNDVLEGWRRQFDARSVHPAAAMAAAPVLGLREAAAQYAVPASAPRRLSMKPPRRLDLFLSCHDRALPASLCEDDRALAVGRQELHLS